MKRVFAPPRRQRDPNLIWNEFISLLAESQADQLDSNQRPADLAFWYDSEVQNGGHLQFFVNRPAALVADTIQALRGLGAIEQAALLKTAFERWTSEKRESPRTADQYVEAAHRAGFDDFDVSYYSVSPSVTELLEKCLEMNRGTFVELIG
jgi:hypothetical protein